MRRALEDKIREIGNKDPKRLLPLPNGRIPDPNDPADMEQILIDLHSNIANNRGPFEGIFKDPERKISPEQEQQLQAALARARDLIAQGRKIEESVRQAQAEAAKQETSFQEQIKKALEIAGAKIALGSDIAGLPLAANAVETQTATVKAQTQTLQSAYDAMTAAGTSCETAANKTCGFAQQVATASKEQVDAWQTEADSAIAAASKALTQAQTNFGTASIAVEELRTHVKTLEGYNDKVGLLMTGDAAAELVGATIENARTAAAAAQQRAEQERAKIPDLLAQVNAIPAQVKSVLAPFAWSEETTVLKAEAGGLGKGLEDWVAFDFASMLASATPVIDAFLAGLKKVEETIKSVQIDALLAAAQTALNEADPLQTKVRALAANPPGQGALQRASVCFADIKSKAAALAAAEVTVPDLSAFTNASEMKAVLQQAGLGGSFTAGGAAPSKDKEFKFATQSPAPDTKVKPGTTVTVAIYQESAAEKVRVPDMSVFSDGSEMRVALQHVGLVGAFVSAGAAPSKDKEFKVQSQSPTPGVMVEPGTEVTGGIYQQFAAEKVRVLDMSVFSDGSEMRVALQHVGLVGAFVSAGAAPSEDEEHKVQSQSPGPGVLVEPGTEVTVAVYEKFADDVASTESQVGAQPSVSGADLSGQWFAKTPAEGGYDIQSLNFTKEGDKWRGPLTLERSVRDDPLAQAIVGELEGVLTMITIAPDKNGGFVLEMEGVTGSAPVGFDGTTLVIPGPEGQGSATFTRTRP